MREIKFRAWDKKLKIMSVEVDLYSGLESWERDRAIVMQYTGLLDKQGKEIYEGDIMKLPNSDKVFKVCYRDNRFVLSGDTCDFADMVYFREREVIGNIYENRELLETK